MELDYKKGDFNFNAIIQHQLEILEEDTLRLRIVASLLKDASLEGWALQKSYPEQDIQTELISVVMRRDIQVRTFHEYQILYDVSEYDKGGLVRNVRNIRKKIFRRQYTEERTLKKLVPKVFDQFEIGSDFRRDIPVQGRSIDIYC